MARRGSCDGSGLIGFLAGLLSGLMVGAILGVLFAPHRGDVTRRKLRRRAEELRDQVEEAADSVTP
jgi:gas vesicle protein